MRGLLTPPPAIEFGYDSKFKFRPMAANKRLKSGGRDRINFKPVEFSFSLNAHRTRVTLATEHLRDLSHPAFVHPFVFSRFSFDIRDGRH
jgi:hypothetical protein